MGNLTRLILLLLCVMIIHTYCMHLFHMEHTISSPGSKVSSTAIRCIITDVACSCSHQCLQHNISTTSLQFCPALLCCMVQYHTAAAVLCTRYAYANSLMSACRAGLVVDSLMNDILAFRKMFSTCNLPHDWAKCPRGKKKRKFCV